MHSASPNPPTWFRSAAAATAWSGAFALLALAHFIVVRACEFDPQTVAIYALYFALHVIVPGVVATSAVKGRALSLTTVIALGVPTGFAIEIFSFLGLSALGLREPWLRFLPVVWLALAVLTRWRHGGWPVRCRWTARHAWLALAMSGLFLWTVLLAASQMYAESPLVGGLPQRPIFHDWVYLLSRAATIKQHWPLEDPSLAGTSLQYHYFMLVHAAAAARVTQLELGTILLRLMVVPLGAVLIVQAYALGRFVSRRAWGGVLAALLTVGATELSFVPHYGQSMFLGFFMRWLYVSPTFFFGMIFFGALLLALAHAAEAGRVRGREYGWLILLAAAATGAKGTVMPVVLLALALWAVWRWCSDRRIPRGLVWIGVVMGGVFLVVYFTTMSAWGDGQASFEPFHVFQITRFWKSWHGSCEQWLGRWLPGAVATPLAAAACGAVAFAGTCGVRLLAIPYLIHGDAQHRQRAAGWLGATLLAGAVLGGVLHLDSNGELYFFLVIRLPLAVLAAAFLVSVGLRLQRWRAAAARPPALLASPAGTPVFTRRWAGRSALVVVAAAGIGLTVAAQSGTSLLRQRNGFTEWMRVGRQAKITDDMRELRETMLWIRRHTERNAVLVANAFTPVQLEQGRGRLVDHTTAGVHFYYSALSERRLWVEGPTYVLQTAVARQRMAAAAEFFAGRVSVPPAVGIDAPCYAVLDRSLGEVRDLALPAYARVFANARFQVYRLPARASGPPGGAGR